MKMKEKCVYKLYFESEQNKVYIGSTTNLRTRMTTHIKSLLSGQHDNYLLQKDFRFKGILDFRYEIIMSSPNITNEMMLKYEAEMIQAYKSNIYGYNITASTNSKNIFHTVIEPDVETMKKIIDEMLKKTNYTLCKMETTYFSDKKNKFSRTWYENMEIEDVKTFATKTFSFISNNSATGKNVGTMVILPYVYIIPALKEIIDTPDCKIRKSCSYISRPSKKKINQIIVTTAFHPFTGEHFSPEEKEIYKIFTFFRTISDNPIADNAKIYVPAIMYDLYKKYFKEDEGEIQTRHKRKRI